MAVRLLEEHSSVLPMWWADSLAAGGDRIARTVITLDAHLDLQWVNEERIAALAACESVESVKALEKRHHLLPDGGTSYSIEDFLYPASRMGLIDRLVWVTPPHIYDGYSDALLQSLQQMPGVSVAELETFRKTREGWVEGRLLGLDLVVCDLADLESMPIPPGSILDIDTDYFVMTPGDTLWTEPADVWEKLRAATYDPTLVTISRSCSSGFTPLKYYRLADALGYLADGSEAGQSRSPQWQGDSESVSNSDGLGDLLRDLCAVRNRQLPVDRLALARYEAALMNTGGDTELRALCENVLGLICCAAGQVDEAIRHHHSIAEGGVSPELGLEIAKLLFASGRNAEIVGYAELGLSGDATCAASHFLLGIAACQSGDLVEGASRLESAHSIAPAWREVIVALAQLASNCGDAAGLAIYSERLTEIDAVGIELANRFSPAG